MKFEGIYAPVITPFNKDFSINKGSLTRVVEHLIDAGIAGIIVSGTTGESYALSITERADLFRFVRQIIGTRVPMLAGIGATCTDDMIALGLAGKSAGADGLLMPAPYYAVPTEKELAEHALAIDRAVGLPIMLYNYPGRTGSNMGVEFLNRVGRSASFCAIKETSGDINRLHMLACRYPNLQLSCGMDDQALEFFVWGARSWVAGGANCLPREHVALYQACVLEKDFEKGRRIMSALMPFMTLLEQGGKFIPTVKYVCAMEGLPAGHVRRPLQPLSQALRRDTETTIRTLKSTMQKIGAPSGQVIEMRRRRATGPRPELTAS